jgi:hypothetical protein
VRFQIGLRVEPGEARLDLPVTGFYLFMIEVIELDCLLQDEEVFGPVVSLNGLGDSFGRCSSLRALS